MVVKAENWKWSSVWRREFGSIQKRKILSSWPVEIPANYLKYLHESQTEADLETIRKSIDKNIPFSSIMWVVKMVDTFKLGQTQRGVGRPKNGG